jgi:aspartate 1-decarboxylase
MLRIMCKSKIHRATVTDANLNYVGSLTLDRNLMQAAGMLPFEQVHLLNLSNGQRAETYIIEGEAGTGQVCVNGALARIAQKDDLVIIVSYALYDEKELGTYQPIIIQVDQTNHIIS